MLCFAPYLFLGVLASLCSYSAAVSLATTGLAQGGRVTMGKARKDLSLMTADIRYRIENYRSLPDGDPLNMAGSGFKKPAILL